MGIVNCEDCARVIDLDTEDDYSVSKDNTYLCEECSNKPSDKVISSATREEIKQHHYEEWLVGIL